MQTMINIKTDKKLKIEAQKISKELGLTLSSVITNYLNTFVIEKRVVFDMNLTPNAKTARLLEQSKKEKISGPFSSAEEMIAHLNKL